MCQQIGVMLNRKNPFAREFNHASELVQQAIDRNEPIPDVILTLRAPGSSSSSTVRGTYNLPTSNDVVIILPGVGDGHEPSERDIHIHGRSSGLKKISHLRPVYTPMQFPIMFPCGDLGYHPGIPLAVVAVISSRYISTTDDSPRYRR